MAKGECVGTVVMAWSMNTTVPWLMDTVKPMDEPNQPNSKDK